MPMLIRSLIIPIFILCVLCALLSFAAQIWGSMYPANLIAFTTIRDTTYSIMLLDITTHISVDSGIHNHYISSLAWSNDGRLAFAASHDNRYEINVWDGNTITNISDAPNSGEPVWSNDGRLAFKAEINSNGNEQIYVWDGSNQYLTKSL
jgi:WD40 repeat protein